MKISMRLSTRLLFVVFACGLTACTDNMPKPQLVVEPENVTMRLAAAADKASSALDQLAAIEQNRTPTDLPPLASSAPPELRRSITVNWIGPVEPIAKQLADRASYQFNITGNKPETPVIVSLNVRNQPVIESLRDVGLQLGGRAELKVDPNLKVIELNYANIQVGEDIAASKQNEHKDIPVKDFNDDMAAKDAN
jgi:defect-in-organelle-trafficking protein DotD